MKDRRRREPNQLTLDFSPESRRRYSEVDLWHAVQRSSNMSEVLRQLGLVPRGGNYESVCDLAERWGIDLSRIQPERGPSHLTMDERTVRAAVEGSRSLAEAIRRLGGRPTKGNYDRLRRAISRYGLSTSHMTGQAWARGTGRPTDELLVEDSRVKTSALRARLLREGLKPHACEHCGRSEWEEQPIPLELDHINGKRRDNRLENLRLLCPNCHALTPTYRGRNIGNAN